jgi:hypothetical protein
MRALLLSFAACVTRAQLQAAQAALVKKEEESKLRVRLQFNLSARSRRLHHRRPLTHVSSRRRSCSAISTLWLE